MLENYRNLVWLGLSISKSVISLLEKRKRPWRVARAKRPIASEHLNGNIVLTPRTVYNFRKGALCCLIPQVEFLHVSRGRSSHLCRIQLTSSGRHEGYHIGFGNGQTWR
ncbi:zinc finger protein 727 isoform X5 [Callithrix jacchus]